MRGEDVTPEGRSSLFNIAHIEIPPKPRHVGCGRGRQKRYDCVHAANRNRAYDAGLKGSERSIQIGGSHIERADVEMLKTYLGEEAQGLADDQIACAVIEKEVRKLRAARTKEKNTPTQR